jgi:hypothetical protein
VAQGQEQIKALAGCGQTFDIPGAKKQGHDGLQPK